MRGNATWERGPVRQALPGGWRKVFTRLNRTGAGAFVGDPVGRVLPASPGGAPDGALARGVLARRAGPGHGKATLLADFANRSGLPSGGVGGG